MKSHARNVKCFWLSGGRPVWRRNTELLKRCRSPKKWTLYCAVKGTHLDLRRIANEKGADVHTDGESCSVRDGLARCGARSDHELHNDGWCRRGFRLPQPHS